MKDALQATLILAVGIMTLYIAGFPLTHIAFEKKKGSLSADAQTALSLFVGYGMIALPLQLLYAANLPIKTTAWPLLIVYLLVFICFAYDQIKRRQWRTLLPSCAFLLIIMGVTLLISLSYLKIGAHYYKGYNWWDNFFYGPQAEFLKEIPYASRGEYIWDHPYALYGGSYVTHRIGRGVYQAFVAALLNIDGASTLGLISIINTPLMFCALLYATKDIKMRKAFRYAACGFAALIPAHVSMYLEGFVVTALCACFITLLCKLLPETFDEPNWLKTAAAGALYSSALSSFQESIYLLIAFLLLSVILALLSRRKNAPSIFHCGAIGGMALVFNAPYLFNIINAIKVSLGSRNLEGIYPFANTVRFFTFAFFGNDLSMVQNPLKYRLLVFFAILLFVIAMGGIIFLFFTKHQPEVFMFLTLALSPLLFLSRENLEMYYVYKTFALSVPVLVFGIWYAMDVAYTQLSTDFLSDWQSKAAARVRKLASRLLAIGCACLFLYSSYCSVRNGLVIIKSDLAVNKHTFDRNENYFPDEDLETFQKLEQLSGKNLLLCSQYTNLSMWWMTYYGRDNALYGLCDNQFAVYTRQNTFATDPKYTQPESVPMDSILLFAPGDRNLITDPEQTDDYAALLAYGERTTAEEGEKEFCVLNYDVRVFARQPAELRVCGRMAFNSGTDLSKVTVSFNGETLENLSYEAGEHSYAFSLPLKAGIQSIQFVLETVDPQAWLTVDDAEITVKP